MNPDGSKQDADIKQEAAAAAPAAAKEAAEEKEGKAQ